MKALLALVSVFALLVLAMSFVNTGTSGVFAGAESSPSGTGEGEITRAPNGEPNCGEEVPDEGDDEGEGGHDDGEDGYDNPDSDDPPIGGIPNTEGDDDDGGRDWDGFDHDDETDDCYGPRPTDTPTPTASPTASPSPTPTPTQPQEDFEATLNSDANCDSAVNAVDALAVVLHVGGAGGGCTGISNGLGIAGDADCNGNVSAADAAAILHQAAALSEAAC